MTNALPWWWLREAECRALGIGPGARRTEGGVLFGDGRAPFRVEIVARTDDAPATVGDVSLRLWGDGAQPKAKLLVAAAALFLRARRGSGFDPTDPSLPFERETPARVDAAPAPSSAGETTARASAASAPEPPQTIIDLPSVCERACVFCGISRNPIPLRKPRGDEDEIDRAIDAAPGPVLFTGDDALSSPRIVERVARAASRGHAVKVIGPPRLGLTAALATRLAAAGLRRWHTGIFGPDATIHDRVAGLPGAFAALVEAAAAMRAAGVVVELLTPLIVDVVPVLGAIAEAAAQITKEPLTIMAYAPDTVVGRDFDAVVARWDEVRAALASVEKARVQVDGVPLCVLPPSWLRRGAGRFERTDAALSPLHPDETCSTCAARARCPGVAATSYRAVGSTGLSPLAPLVDDLAAPAR